MCVPGRYRRGINATTGYGAGFEGKASSSEKYEEGKKTEKEEEGNEQEGERVVLNFARNSFFLVSYLLPSSFSLSFSRSFALPVSFFPYVFVCYFTITKLPSVDVGDVIFNVPSHEY